MEPDNWEGVFLHSPTLIDVADYDAIRFWIHGGPGGGQLLRLSVQLGSSSLGSATIPMLTAGGWAEHVISLADLGMPSGPFDGVTFQDDSGANQATLFLDDIALVESNSPPPKPVAIAIQLDPNAPGRAIDPLIYGVNFGDPAQLGDVPFPLRRWGGNAVTRYNWRTDVSNRGADWFFMNIPAPVDDVPSLPDGSSSDVFVDETLAAGSQALLTAPMIGWSADDERTKKWSFSTSLYGPQLLTECSYFDPPPSWCQPTAGDGNCDPGVNTTGYCSSDGLIVGNDPNDANQIITTAWVTDWMAHIASRVGTAGNGGPRYWALDNEPMLWSSTHRDVHAVPPTYDEIWSRTVEYASAIKDQDPDAVVLGPDVWGWCAYFTSASDAALGGSCVDGPDRQSHGGEPFLAWYLDQICEYEATQGIRLIDVLDVHMYPQGGVTGHGGAGEDPVTAARRLRSLKELWDPTYVSESWIDQPIALIPWLKGMIDDHCPGMRLSLTEYNWGSDDGPSGALAQAEVLAIFGREGLDIGARWVAPESGTRTEDAFRLYLNYDGAGAQIQGDSIPATSADVDRVGAYAVRNPTGDLFVLLFNKDLLSREAIVTTTADWTGTASVYRFDGANGLAWIEDLAHATRSFSSTLPPRSATLVVTRLAAPGAIFADGFESGDSSAWSDAVP
jgi:hypothetical protein